MAFNKGRRGTARNKSLLKSKAGVATVVKRAAEQGKLEGRNKIQHLT